MTTKDFKKMFKQLAAKPAKLAKYKKHNAPKDRTTGQNLRHCRRCGQTNAHIQKYGLHLCRHCFREIAQEIGFHKYR